VADHRVDERGLFLQPAKPRAQNLGGGAKTILFRLMWRISQGNA
jgi:hypothetical protein